MVNNYQLRSRKHRTFMCGLLMAVFLLSGCIANREDTTPSTLSSKRLLEVDGAVLEQIFLEQQNKIYLQTIDLRRMQIDQIIGKIESKESKSLYYPSLAGVSSPFFERLTPTAARSRYQEQHPSTVFSVINASFFEEYESSTRLSFPIKLNGVLISGGSSPYGPVQKPADAYYRRVKLKALVWDSDTVKIIDYDPATGYPLNQPDIENALVSYDYRDHPAYVLADDPVNYYHVIGIVESEKDSKAGNKLLVATAARSTLKQAAEMLRQRGVKGTIMTIDGGISTYLWNVKAGDLVLPQVASGETVPALPHYLGIRSKDE